MPAVGNFIAFGDTSVVLEIGGDIDNSYTVPLPGNLIRGGGSMAVLIMRVGAEGDVNRLVWNTTVNGTSIFAVSHTGPTVTAIQEVFDTNLLRAGDDNTVTVTVTSGTGRLRISDFVLHHQINV